MLAPPFQDHFAEFGSVLDECEFNNPRKIKRIVNRYLLFLNQHEHELEGYIIKNVIRLLIIAEYYPQIFQLVVGESIALIEDSRNSQNTTPAPFRQLGGTFDIDAFEKQYGIHIRSYFAQLLRMKALFKFTEPNRQQHNMHKHIQDVFSITRLI